MAGRIRRPLPVCRDVQGLAGAAVGVEDLRHDGTAVDDERAAVYAGLTVACVEGDRLLPAQRAARDERAADTADGRRGVIDEVDVRRIHVVLGGE